MRVAIRSRFALLAFALAAVLNTGAGRAQAINQHLRATIPFAFEVGTRHCAAGKYDLWLLSQHMLGFRSSEMCAVAAMNPDTTVRPASKGQLLFHRYGNRYFLRELHVANSNDYLLLPE